MSVSILIVDDEPDVAELFRQRFRREVRQGLYVLHFADSGEGALDMLSEGIRPELIVILSDINMPGMDGLALLGEIKQRWPELPVMMVTAYGDDERRRMADARGAADFIAKPVDFDFLKQHLLLFAPPAGCGGRRGNGAGLDPRRRPRTPTLATASTTDTPPGPHSCLSLLLGPAHV